MFTGAKGEVKLITLDPGHFHAALVQKKMYELRTESRKDGDKNAAEFYLKKGNMLRSRYAAVMAIIQFETVKVRKAVKGKEHGVIRSEPNFDTFQVGKLELTYDQLMKLRLLFKAENDEGEVKYPQLLKENGILHYVLDFHKYKIGEKDTYTRVGEIIPLIKEKVSRKDFKLSEEDVPDTSAEFKEEDDLSTIADIIISEIESESEEYSEEDLEKEDGKKSKDIDKSAKPKTSKASEKTTKKEVQVTKKKNPKDGFVDDVPEEEEDSDDEDEDDF